MCQILCTAFDVNNQLFVKNEQQKSRNSSSSAKSAYVTPDQADSRALIFKNFFCFYLYFSPLWGKC